jgi:hypothetical protein
LLNRKQEEDMSHEKIGKIAGLFGWVATIGLILLLLMKLDFIDIGLLPLVITVLGIGFLGVVVFGGWYFYFS